MAFWQNFKEQLGGTWSAVDAGTKVISIMVGVVLLASIAVAIYFNRKPQNTLLYGQLSQSTAAAIVSELDDNNVDYVLRNGGRDIYVPKGRANQLRLLMKRQGLLKDGESIGFEIFDKSQFGVTEKVQSIQHNRALAGEIERTINGVQGVKSSRVIIAPAENTLFQEDQKVTTATVFLNLNFEDALDANQVRGVQQLTASAVEGLSPKEVTVVDNFGNTLSPQVEDEDMGSMVSSRIGIQKSVEKYYTRKIQSMLEVVLGREGTIVRVDAKLDFDKVEETEEKYDPESAVVRNETITSENVSGSSGAPGGPPGVQSNLQPGAATGGGASQENNSNREVINNKYEIDRTVRHITRGVGDIQMLTVSVFVAQKPILDENGEIVLDENGNPTFTQRSAEDLTSFTEIVKNAMGYNESRGDKIVLKETPFENAGKKPPDPSLFKSDTDVNMYMGTIGKLLMFLIFVFVVFLQLKKGASRETTEGPRVGGGSGGAAAGTMDGGDTGLEALDRGAFIESRISKVVNQFPDESEQVIRNWLKE